MVLCFCVMSMSTDMCTTEVPSLSLYTSHTYSTCIYMNINLVSKETKCCKEKESVAVSFIVLPLECLWRPLLTISSSRTLILYCYDKISKLKYRSVGDRNCSSRVWTLCHEMVRNLYFGYIWNWVFSFTFSPFYGPWRNNDSYCIGDCDEEKTKPGTRAMIYPVTNIFTD